MNKIYFVSDFHLGVNARLSSREREQKIIRWLDIAKQDARAIYLMGDVFDFWFEYKTVVPKGYTRLLGKLAEITDAGIEMHFFIGNHDMWMFRYFEEELGIKTHRTPVVHEWFNKRFYLGHGDGLGPGDYGYKFIKKVFANPLCQWAFARIHPNFGIGLANFWSGRSREANQHDAVFEAKEKEWLYIYANEQLEQTYYDYFVFGHRHIPMNILLKNNRSRYINLGDWVSHFSYAVFDGEKVDVLFFEREDGIVHT